MSPSSTFPGGRIVFVSRHNGHDEVCSSNYDGSSVRSLTPDRFHNYLSPDVSADGTLVVLHYESGLYLMDDWGRDFRLLTSVSTNVTWPALSPDGSQVAYIDADNEGFAHIHLINVDGSHKTALTSGQINHLAPRFIDGGRRVAFLKYTSGIDVYSVDLSGGDETQLSYIGDLSGPFSLSPDGETLVFGRTEGSSVHIWSARVNSAEPAQKLTSDEYDGDRNVWPDWSPDGSKIAFMSRRWGKAQLWFMDPDGGNKETFLWFDENFSPSWGGEPPTKQLVVRAHEETSSETSQDNK